MALYVWISVGVRKRSRGEGMRRVKVVATERRRFRKGVVAIDGMEWEALRLLGTGVIVDVLLIFSCTRSRASSSSSSSSSSSDA